LAKGIVFVVFDNNFVSKLVLKDLCHFVGNIGSGNCCFGHNLQFNAHFLPSVSSCWAASGFSRLHGSIVGFIMRFGWAWIDRSRELLDVSSRGCHGGKMLSQE
jgi:hypothetical protein